ncbi:MAG: alpha/beta hydrolase [Gammaproteobacteria bacterium]|nr:alpha/beta hydrolase [Gammaproteobacteria bacterium]
MPRLAVEDDRQLHYEFHEGPKRPVVLIHGWGANTRVWDTVTAALTDAGHAVLCYDQRACGQSDKDFRANDVALGIGDAVKLIEHLGLQGCVVNGWSLGGAVAVGAAHALGGRCAGVVLTGGATPRYVQAADFPHGGEAEAVAQTVAALRADRPAFLWQLATAVCAKEPAAGINDWLRTIFWQTSPVADAALASLAQLDQRRELAELSMPLLSMIGSEDAFVDPAIGRLAAEMAPHGRLSEYEGVGHAPFLEDAERYRRELLEFVAGLG